MKNKLELTILREDILLDNYMDSETCPITKALGRAGENWKDVGGGIRNDDDDIIAGDEENDSYRELLKKLFSMYNSPEMNKKYCCEGTNPVIPAEKVETFTHTLIW